MSAFHLSLSNSTDERFRKERQSRRTYFESWARDVNRAIAFETKFEGLCDTLSSLSNAAANAPALRQLLQPAARPAPAAAPAPSAVEQLATARAAVNFLREQMAKAVALAAAAFKEATELAAAGAAEGRE